MNYRYKLLLSFAATVSLLAGCNDSDSTYDPGITFSKTGDVAFVASIENCTSRASLVNTGEARWLRDDAIGAVCTDGTVAQLKLDGTGETRRAIFKGTVPAGKEIGGYAVHPSSATISGNTLSVELPATISCATTGDCSVMVAEINNSTDIAFRQLMSYISLQINEVNSDASTIVLTSDMSLSGTYTATLPDAMTTGLEAKTGDGEITITLPDKKDATIFASLALPTGQYTSLTATAYNAKGQKLSEVECLSSVMNAERGQIRPIVATMPKVSITKPQIEGTVLVAGIYWATGNLQYIEGTSAEGFQDNWRFAPEQWQFVNYENAKTNNKAVTFNATDYSQTDHFNWGGIAKPFDFDPASSATAAVGTDISGKMFTSQDCTVATTDFSAAHFGDIAFWATKGKYRLPTQAEFMKLITDASCEYANYSIGGDNVVSGLYFYDPEEGESPIVSDEVRMLTDEDMTKGLFLPKSGRRYNTRDFIINVQGTQGVYWTSGSITGDGAKEPCYGAVFSIQNAIYKYPYWNAAFDAKAGFSIRAVYIEK